jgi:DNA-binding XRE family transcriptional regulator
MATSADFIHTWYVMPRKPRFIHPVRQVRTCLAHSQSSFAKLIGCSAVAVQRIENGQLQLSSKLANSILEATGADPVSLLAGREAKAMDMMGCEYSKSSYDFYRTVLPCDDKEWMELMMAIFHQLQLLFVVSNRGGKFKTYAVNSALQTALAKLAHDFNLTKSIHNYLLENGHIAKRIYRVSDLRKFSEYARILGYKDNKRYKPDKLIPFTIPRGWLYDYVLSEKPVLPHGADMKMRHATYVLDSQRYIPPEVKEALAQTLYWEILEFRTSFAEKPIR